MASNNESFTSEFENSLIDEFLALSTPQELDRTKNRMLMAARIFDGMKKKGISKKKFAELTGQRPSVITKWLSGGQNFTLDTLTDIQQILGIKLLKLEDRPESKEILFSVTVKNSRSDDSTKIQNYPTTYSQINPINYSGFGSHLVTGFNAFS